MVFQEGALAPHWDSRKNIGFYLDLRKRGHELPERLEKIVEITGFGLDRILDRKPGSLSGGEKQRVAIARALARDLKLLLLDEPFANLDAAHRRDARLELKRLIQELPTTTVYSTHDQEEAGAVGDRIGVMMQGRILQIGTYTQLYETPRDLRIAEFIGVPPMNRLEGTVQDGIWQGENFGGYPIRSDLSPGAPVTLGIRPEGVLLGSGGSLGKVEQITPFFRARRNLIELSGAGERWIAWSPMEIKLEIGEILKCDLDHESIHYFDPGSGRRIGGAR
jgi:multiple sugar transport system ATP-binding protein